MSAQIEIPENVTTQIHEWEVKKGKSSFNADEELRSLKAVFDKQEVQEMLLNHAIDKFVAAGGSGIILRVLYQPHGTYRVLKVPRAPLLLETSTRAPEDPEVHALGKINHEHIPRLFASVSLKQGTTLMLSEYIDDEKELVPFVDSVCKTAEKDPNEHAARKVLLKLTELLYQICGALDYMHTIVGLFHFDIKPGNILVSGVSTERPKAWIIDMGLAKDASKFKPNDEIPVSFTLKYAHPRLTNCELKITRTQNKSDSSISGSELDARYDLFALGRSIQECLKVIRSYFGQQAHRLYEFEYLHMLACLCLDGEIRRVDPVADRDKSYEFVEDVSNGCGADLFRRHKFKRVEEALLALERLLGRYTIERDVPELDPWYSATINASDVAFANLTERVRRIVVQPLFKRLERERQLGFLSEVFPTATHTRGNHSLGVYAATCRYISALYHDPENPTCKLLFTKECIKVVLVASLIHDLGQTAFGHDIEELDEEIFDHGSFTKKLLELADQSRSYLNESLDVVLEDEEPRGWGLGPQAIPKLVNFLSRRSNDQDLPILGLIRQIIDGPIDADKLDYIVRDSVDCRVQYGYGIDVERFIRSITAHWTDVENHVNDEVGPLQLAIRAKGKASADAFILARTQLYQSVYWHHTFRAIKAMFLSAVSIAIIHQKNILRGKPFVELYQQRQRLASGELSLRSNSEPKKYRDQFNEILHETYFYHVYALPLGLSRSARMQDFNVFGKLEYQVLEQFSGISVDRTLDFFYQLGDECAKKLLSELVQRKFYKRIWEMPVASMNKKTIDRVIKRLKDLDSRVTICEQVGKNLYSALTTAIGSSGTTIYAHSSDIAYEKLKQVWQPSANVITDMPLRVVDSVIASPEFVSDYRRKYFHSITQPKERSASATWRDDVGTLLKESAYLRVFVRPEVHPLILQYLDQKSLDSALGPLYR